MDRPLVIYCYDAYCGWCYGFSRVMLEFWKTYRHRFDFEVLSGGMIPKESAVHIGKTATYIAQAYKRVESISGIKFGEDYLWHIRNPDESDWYPHSEKAAIALCIFKEYFPEDGPRIAADIQHALHYEGRDLTDDEAYRHLVENYKINADGFYKKLKDPAYAEKVHYEFALVKQLQVSGFPALFLQVAESRFYLLAHGYTSFEALQGTMEEVIKELKDIA